MKGKKTARREETKSNGKKTKIARDKTHTYYPDVFRVDGKSFH